MSFSFWQRWISFWALKQEEYFVLFAYTAAERKTSRRPPRELLGAGGTSFSRRSDAFGQSSKIIQTNPTLRPDHLSSPTTIFEETSVHWEDKEASVVNTTREGSRRWDDKTEGREGGKVKLLGKYSSHTVLKWPPLMDRLAPFYWPRRRIEAPYAELEARRRGQCFISPRTWIRALKARRQCVARSLDSKVSAFYCLKEEDNASREWITISSNYFALFPLAPL